MSEIKHVVIGIQARSSSKRFPMKAFEEIDGRPMMRWVIDAVDGAAYYLNRYTHRTGIRASYVVLVPHGDPIKKAFSGRAMVMEGPEDDVLTRYWNASEILGADYMVRVTGDCPLLPPYLITKHVKIAITNKYDYCSNVDESGRTAIDGHDVEIMSARALEWAHQKAIEAKDREHVTTILRTPAFEEQFSVGQIVGFLNQSHLKLSVDDLDDLERVRVEVDRLKRAHHAAENKVGRQNVHKF